MRNAGRRRILRWLAVAGREATVSVMCPGIPLGAVGQNDLKRLAVSSVTLSICSGSLTAAYVGGIFPPMEAIARFHQRGLVLLVAGEIDLTNADEFYARATGL